MITARQRQDKMNYESKLNVQPKDPSKRHFYLSIVKSLLRIGAGATLAFGMFYAAGVLFVAAEIFGIVEEL